MWKMIDQEINTERKVCGLGEDVMNNDEIDQRLAEAMTEMAALTLECQQLLRVRAQRGAGRRREPAQERPAARA